MSKGCLCCADMFVQGTCSLWSRAAVNKGFWSLTYFAKTLWASFKVTTWFDREWQEQLAGKISRNSVERMKCGWRQRCKFYPLKISTKALKFLTLCCSSERTRFLTKWRLCSPWILVLGFLKSRSYLPMSRGCKLTF